MMPPAINEIDMLERSGQDVHNAIAYFYVALAEAKTREDVLRVGDMTRGLFDAIEAVDRAAVSALGRFL
jgi:hypothetical protein